MQAQLQRFITRLRHRGVDISTGEHLDALAALEHVQWLDRAAFCEALRATLVKHPDHLAVFDEEFAAFFAPPPLPKATRRGKKGAGGKRESGRGQMRQGREAAHQVRPGAGGDRRAQQAASVSPGEAHAAPQRAERQGSATPAEEPTGSGHRVTFRGVRPPGVERSVQQLSRAELNSLTPAESRELRRYVRILARRLASRLSRRRKTSKHGHPDLKRTVRKSLQFGGVPFLLTRKQRRRAIADIVVLCDVSGSMLRAAELALTFLHTLGRENLRLRVFAYTNRVAEVSLRGSDVGPDLATQAQAAGLDLHAFSDFGHACYDLATRYPAIIGRHTTLLVVGDARNNYGDPMVWAFQQIAAPAKRVVWLVPEPRQRWNTGDSQIGAYAEHCHVVAECHTLQRLLRALQRV